MNNHSFAILAYKDSPYIVDCLESIINQTLKSQIYISTSTPSAFIDDLAKKYNVEVFVTESGKGSLHDCNFALRNAKTKYVTLAHQDDIYLPEYAEACVASAENFRDSSICFTDYSEITNNSERPVNFALKVKRFILWLFMPFNKNIRKKFWKKKFLSIGNPISAPTVMFNLENLPGFQFVSNFLDNLDWDVWYKLAEVEGRFVYINKVLLKRRIHLESKTSIGLESNLRYEEDLQMFERFWPGFIAKILVKVYSISYKANTIERIE